MLPRNPHDSPGQMLVARETLHMLGVVLQAAFRMHCTGETLAGKGPWQLVRDVQHKLRELQSGVQPLVSQERLAEFVEALAGPPGPATPLTQWEDAA